MMTNVNSLARDWWIIVLRGLAAVLFGIVAFVWPNVTLAALVLLFGAYVLVDGVLGLVVGLTRKSERRRWWVLALEGLAGIALGVLTFLSPQVTALVLLYGIAAWAILTGVLEIAAAIRLRKEIDNEVLLGLSGVVSIGLGVLLVLFPGAGAVSLIWMLGAYALVFGLILMALGFRLRARSSPRPRTA
jgi:uncharacterized membrane protein HdeD (DUF308 family)